MKEYLHKCQHVLMLALLTLPVMLVMGVHAFLQRMWLCALLPGLYALFAAGCMAIRGRARLWTGLALGAVLTAVCVLLLPWRQYWWTLSAAVIYPVLLMATLPIGAWPYDRELSFNTCVGGLGLFAVAQMRFMFRPENCEGANRALIACFLLYGVLWLFMLNRQSLHDAAAKGNRAPQDMRRRNHMLTVGLILLILLISAIPALSRALAWAWDRMMELIAAVGRFLSGLLPEVTTGGGGGGAEQTQMLTAESAEPSLLALVLEKIVFVLVGVGLAVAVFFALRTVWRKLCRLAARMWKWMNRYAQAASEDYVDEITDTRTMGDAAASGRKRRMDSWLHRINEEKLSPVERVRYRYRRMLRRHPEWLPGSTARENLPPQAAAIYEKARYSEREVSGLEAQAFMEQLEKKSGRP